MGRLEASAQRFTLFLEEARGLCAEVNTSLLRRLEASAQRLIPLF